ncbi:hypothetical protein ACIP1T_28510 [Pseudomonas japonica]|uniref:hypothetical protein n=1 Tax=Pseudomonas japonica TaxID=256466 RepID=UPI003817D889
MRTSPDTPTAVLNLDPLLIPGLIVPVQTEGAVGGVNDNMLHANHNGLLVQIQPYLNMQEGDWLEVFWGSAASPVAADKVLDEHVGEKFSLFIRANRIPDGVSEVWFTVTRSGGENGGESTPIGILVRTEIPGDTDPEPDLPGHQNLPPPEPELPPSGIIDEEAAKNGVKVTIGAYPNMRRFDIITLSWGGELLEHEVTQDEVDAGSLDILVTEEVILEAGDSDELVLVYKVRDEVDNPSSDWSPRTLVIVEVGVGLFYPPVIVNPDPDTEFFDVIDLDILGDADLVVEVYADRDGDLLVDDVVALKWLGTTAQGQPIGVELPEQTVSRVPTRLDFLIPNADVRQLARGRAVASYAVTRDGNPAGASKRSFASFLGEALRLPKPTVRDALDGVLDPGLAETVVIVPGEALEADDTLTLVWLGTRANGSPLLHEVVRGISDGSAGKPMSFIIAGDELIAPLDGGTLSVYYRLLKRSGVELESERETLRVGEARGELPAPFTRPAAVDGVLDPAEISAQLEIVVAPWPGMRDGQDLSLSWRASSGPHHDDAMYISPPLVGQEVVFHLDRERVEENLGANVQITYRVESPDEPTLVSQIAAFSVEARRTILPLPLILEAEGDRLDPNDVLDGASVYLDASAQLHDGDLVTVHIVSTAEGGSIDVPWPVPVGGGGQPATIMVPYETIAASTGTLIGVHYSITRDADGRVDLSGTASYSVYSELDAGALRIMGARFNASILRAGGVPRMLTALHDQTLAPMLVEWRYEDTQQWTAATQWVDEKPWLKLYARSASETWECRPANITGNGIRHHVTGSAAFVAMRDEVLNGSELQVDMVAWGNVGYGGELDEELAGLKNVAEVTASLGGYAARLREGNVVSWGTRDLNIPSVILGDFTQIRSNSFAFAGLDAEGGLSAWGSDNNGGTVPDDLLQYSDYVQLVGALVAFAARRRSGHVVAWGDPDEGGELLAGQEHFNDITQLIGNSGAFAALRDSGGMRRVIAWGNRNTGGDVPVDIASLTNVHSIAAASYRSFCILLDNGEARVWGGAGEDSQIPDDMKPLMNVVEVSASADAFCARLSDGRVVAWGSSSSGGELTKEVAGKSNIVQVTGNQTSFAALCSDGSVVAWGASQSGGDTSPVADQLFDVRAIYGNSHAFTALTKDGRVVTWGNPANGGDSDKVQPELNGKVTASRLLSAREAAALSAPQPTPSTTK